MNNILNKFKFFILAISLIIVSGCEKGFLDINENPNNPVNVPLVQLTPSIQVDITNGLGLAVGGLSAYTTTFLHQFSGRGADYSDYGITGNDFEIVVPWDNFYAKALTDIEVMIEQGIEEENFHYVGIAQIMKAYLFSQMVDVWGDIPFSEANKGSEVPFPKFDNGQDIYPQLFILLDEGIANLEAASNISPGADDLFYGGNLNKWRKLAKTVKLKMYNQIRLVQEVSTQVSALINEGDLIGPDDDFELQYGSSISPDSRNPAYTQEWAPGGARYYISPYFYEILTGQNSFFPENIYLGIEDPRVPYYFYNQLTPDRDAENPTSYRDGAFVSIYAFSFNIDPNEGFDQSSSQTVAGLYPLGGRYDDGSGVVANLNGHPQVPQRLLPHFSQLYIRAELAQVGVTSEDPRTLLESAITASFAKVNEIAAGVSAPSISDGEIEEYVANVLALYDAGSAAKKLEHIITQKWIASFGFGIDMYTDYRRTGYPIIHDGNTDNLSVTVRTRDFPVSFPYDSNDLSINPNSPSQRRIALDRVFWQR